ncbi:MAG: hypothetical protein U0269_25950 [Polyangiales bacterium]
MTQRKTPSDLSSWRARALQPIEDIDEAVALRPVLRALDPAADLAITREALAMLCFADPRLLVKSGAVYEWLDRVDQSVPTLRVHAWLAKMLYQWGLLDAQERNVGDGPDCDFAAYEDALAFIFDRPVVESTAVLVRWWLWLAKRNPALLERALPVAIERLCQRLRELPPSSDPRSLTGSMVICAFAARDAIARDEEVPAWARPSIGALWLAVARADPQNAKHFIERIRRALPALLDALFADGAAPSPALLRSALSIWDEVTLESHPSIASEIAAKHSRTLAALYLLGQRAGQDARPLLIAIRDERSLLPALAAAIDANDAREAWSLWYAVPFDDAAALVAERIASRPPKRRSLLSELAALVEERRSR